MGKVVNNLLSLKLRSLVTEFRSESAALWFFCFYIFIEYIRPHDMYPVLQFLPWGQITILLTLGSIFVTGSRANGFGALDKMFIVFSLIVILSGFFAWRPASSLEFWSTYTSWILLYFCTISILNSSNRLFLFILFFILINFKLSEHGAWSFAMRGFSFTHWGLTGPPGWFHNSGEFAMQMVIVFSISLSLILAAKKYIESSRRWWLLLFLFPGTAALSVIGSSSRGGQIALAAIVIIFLLKGKYFLRKALLLTLIVYLTPHLLPEEQLNRFSTMGDDQTSQLRLEHWENALEVLKHNPLGIGYFNWRHYYPAHFDIIKVEEIHNTALQAFVELGYPGGILFLIMLITAFVMNIRTISEMNRNETAKADAMAAMARGINLGLLGTAIAASFMSVLFYPVFWLAFALTSALRHTSKSIVKETTPAFNKTSLQKINNTPIRETRPKNSHHGKIKHHFK